MHTPEVDDDFDELDSFAPEANISEELENEKKKRAVPPVKVMDPADAQDLKEFLEAEERRKEEFGDVDADLDEDESDDVRDFREYEEYDDVDETEGEDEDENEGEDEEDASNTSEDDVGGEDPLEEWDATPPPSSQLMQSTDNMSPLEDDESEDELGIWEDDESNAVYVVPHDSDDEIEIIEPPPASSSPLTTPQRPSTSRASVTPHSTPWMRQPGSVKGLPEAPKQPIFAQLQTPPRSQSSAAESYTSDVFLSNYDVPPRSTPITLKSQHIGRIRPRPTPVYKGAKAETPTSSTKSKAISDIEPLRVSSALAAQPTPLRTSTPARPTKKEETQIPIATPGKRSPSKLLPPSYEESDVPETPEPEDQRRRLDSQEEGPDYIGFSDSDDPISLPSSPTKDKGKAKANPNAKSQGKGKGKDLGVAAPLGTKATRDRKRKRIASGNDSWEMSGDGTPRAGHAEDESLAACPISSMVIGKKSRPQRKIPRSAAKISDEVPGQSRANAHSIEGMLLTRPSRCRRPAL